MGNTYITMRPKRSLLKNIQKLTPSSLSGTYFRSVSFEYQGKVLDTQGSFEHGGRYNPIGELGALYVSDSEDLCRAEVEKRIKSGCADSHAIRKIRIALTKVLDLTKPGNLRKLGIARQDLTQQRNEGGWVLTQDIARSAYKSGYEAILAPSATSKGNNLTIFDKHIDATRIQVVSKARA